MKEIALDTPTIKAIAKEVARQLMRDELPEFVTTKQAARILNITPSRMRQIKDKFPHIKKGADKQAKLLFKKADLIAKATC